MFGSVGFRLGQRAAIGICPAPQGIVLVHLAADSAAWTVTESCAAACTWAAGDDAAVLASCVRAELLRAGWDKMPLALALPLDETEITEWELPVPLVGEELRSALLWSLCAERGESAETTSMCLCCDAVGDAIRPRYWTAQVDRVRVDGFFAAFAAEGLHLRRLTVCPPAGGTSRELIAQALVPHMPWEIENAADDAAELSAVYAGLLFRRDAPAHLYWDVGRPLRAVLRRHAAAAIALTATALFLAGTAADASAWLHAEKMRMHAEEELALRDGERRRMEELSRMQADTERREQRLADFWAASLPLHALLVHLGQLPLEDIRLTAVHASAHEVFLEGDAESFAALSSLTAALEERAFFSGDVSLERVEQMPAVQRMGTGAHFVVRAVW